MNIQRVKSGRISSAVHALLAIILLVFVCAACKDQQAEMPMATPTETAEVTIEPIPTPDPKAVLQEAIATRVYRLINDERWYHPHTYTWTEGRDVYFECYHAVEDEMNWAEDGRDFIDVLIDYAPNDEYDNYYVARYEIYENGDVGTLPAWQFGADLDSFAARECIGEGAVSIPFEPTRPTYDVSDEEIQELIGKISDYLLSGGYDYENMHEIAVSRYYKGAHRTEVTYRYANGYSIANVSTETGEFWNSGRLTGYDDESPELEERTMRFINRMYELSVPIVLEATD